MEDGDVVPPGEGDDLFEEGEIGDGAGGVIGVVEPEDLGLFGDIGGDSVEVGLPAGFAGAIAANSSAFFTAFFNDASSRSLTE